MTTIKMVMLSVAVLVLTACGGGGGGGGGNGAGKNTSISVSPIQLTFNNTPYSTAQTEVHVTFKGDGVIVGYPVGIADPGWLSVAEVSHTATSAIFSVSAASVGTPGTYKSTLRFITGREDGSDIKYVDVEVTNNVFEQFDVSFESNASFVGKKSVGVTSPLEGYPIHINLSTTNWTITSETPWLTFSQHAGRGAATVVVSADVSKAEYGISQGSFSVKSAEQNITKTFSVSLDVKHAQPVISTPLVEFNINGETDVGELIKELVITDENNGTVAAEIYDWSFISRSSSSPWLSLSKTSGSTGDSDHPKLVIDKNYFSQLNGSVWGGEIALSLRNQFQRSVEYTVKVNLSVNLPQLSNISPYIGVEGKVNKAIVRGQGLPANIDDAVLSIAGQIVTVEAVDDSSQMRIKIPPLSPGLYTLGVENKLGIETPLLTYMVVSQNGLVSSSIESASRREKILYDAERQQLFAVNRDDSIVERYKLIDGNWVQLAYLAVPALTDISLSPDGNILLVLSKKNIYTVDLHSENFQSTLVRFLDSDWCGIYMDHGAMTNTGDYLIVQKYENCSGYTDFAKFSLQEGNFSEINFRAYNGIAIATTDGSRVYIGGNGLSPAPEVSMYQSLDGSFTTTPVNYNLSAISVGKDGSKVILQDTDVYSSSLVLLGNLPYGVALVSGDSSKAYIYRDDHSQPRVEVYDLNGTLQLGAIYPLVNTINVAPILSNNGALYNVKMVESPEGKTLFLSGDLRIAVINLE